MDYNKYSKDVHTIIDNLSKEESNHIGNGYWVDSNHIIYRKVEYIGNKPVGFIDVYSLPKFKNYGLIIIAVSKDARGKGVGKKLVNSAIQNCKNNKDINKLRWLADSDNTASINMAKSLGFKLNSDGEDKKEFIYDLKNNKFITEASTALYAGVGTLLMSCLVYEKLIKSTNEHDKIKFKMEKLKNDLRNKETSYKCKSKNEVSKDFEILSDDAENILKSNLKEVADLYIKAYNESNFKKEYGKYFKIFPQKYDTEYTLTYKKNETRCMYSIFLNVATISVNNPDEDVVSKIMDEADEILDIYSKKRNKLKIDHDIDIEEQSTWDNNGCDKNIYLSYYIWLKPKSNTDMYKETTGYDKYSNDIHMIIDNLSKRDRSYIGSDYWLTADYIVYRNVEYDNGVPIGFIDLHQNPNSKGFAVMTIAINKELCSKNIDKKLIYSAMEFCKNNGIYELRWLVGSDDTYKFNLAKSLNFELLYNIDDERCFIYDINNFNSSEISMESVIFSTDNIEYNTDTLKHNSDNQALWIYGDRSIIVESCKDAESERKFLQEVDNLSKKYDANFFIVTDGASMTRNGRGKSEPAVKNARDKQIEWEKKNGGNPDEGLKHINESTLPSKERRKLDDDVFGIPSLRKYPLNDKAHVLAAIRMFNRVDRKHEKELAHNIIAAMEKYKISTDIIGPKNRLQTYI